MRTGIAVWLVLLHASVGVAQTSHPPPSMYVSAGWVATSRDPGKFFTAANQEFPRYFVHGLSVAAGERVHPRIALEGEVQFQSAQSILWKYTYLFARNSEQRTDDSDMPVIGHARFTAFRNARLALEPTVGGGVVFHHAASLILSDCGSGSLPTMCVPLAPPVEGDDLTTAEWTFATGLDIALRAGRHVAVVPGVHLQRARRRQFLTGHDHRGPMVGSGWLPSFGISVRWQSAPW